MASGKGEKVKLKIKGMRLSYPDIFKGTANANGNVRFSCDLIIPKAKGILKPLTDSCNSFIKDNFGEDEAPKLTAPRSPIKDGDKWLNQDGELQTIKYPEYEGVYILKCATYTRPSCVMQKGAAELTEFTRDFYAGCFVWAAVTPEKYVFENKPGLRLAINSLLCLGEGGEAFGSSNDATEDFGSEIDTADSDFSGDASEAAEIIDASEEDVFA